MTGAGDHQALQGAGPVLFQGLGHRRGGLAGADHHGAARGRLRQVRGQSTGRVRRGQRRIEERAQEGPRPGRGGLGHTSWKPCA